VISSKSLTKNHNPLLYDWPRNFNGLLQIVTVLWNSQKLGYSFIKCKPTSFCHCTTRYPPSALHLTTPLPHSHPLSSNNTYIPNKKKRHKGVNAMKHHRISIWWSSLSPFCWKQKLLVANKKKMLPWKTLKPLFVHTQNPKVGNLLQDIYMSQCCGIDFAFRIQFIFSPLGGFDRLAPSYIEKSSIEE